MDWLCLGVNLQLGKINFLEGVSDTAGCKKHFKRKPDFMNFTVQISRGFGWRSWSNPRSAYAGFVLAVCTGFGKLDRTQKYDTLFQLWPAERKVEKLAHRASVSPMQKSLIWKMFHAFQIKENIWIKICFLNWWISKISYTTILKLNEDLLLSLHEELSPYLTSFGVFFNISPLVHCCL